MYAERLKVLHKLGFVCYDDYLASPLWDIIRRAVLHRDHCQCSSRKCEAKNFPRQVHHLSYRLPVMLGLDTSALITLCSECHYRIEHSKKGKKLTYRSVRNRTRKEVGADKPAWSEVFVAARTLPQIIRTSPHYGIIVADELLRAPESYQSMLIPILAKESSHAESIESSGNWFRSET